MMGLFFPALPRLAATALILFSTAGAAQDIPLLGDLDLSLYRTAFASLEDGASGADAMAAIGPDVSDHTLLEVLEWRRLTQTGQFEEIAAFLATHADWPERTTLRLNAERSIPQDVATETLIAHFNDQPPLTVLAAARHEEALRLSGREQEARDHIESAWSSLPLSTDQLALFAGYLPYLDETAHANRFDAMLAAGRTDEARAMLSYLPDGYEALMAARIALEQRDDDVNQRVQAVPQALVGDAGLIYWRARWRRISGLIDGAIEMLDRQPEHANGPQWWQERRAIARLLVRRGDAGRAYRIASGHHQTEGLSRYQAEFLSGWIALRRMAEPERAQTHFETLWQTSTTPIGLAAAAYWIARCRLELGDGAGADRWFAEAAGRPTTYYGQVAANRMGVDIEVPRTRITDADRERFAGLTESRIVAQLHQIGEIGLRDRFAMVLVRQLETEGEFALTAALTGRLGMNWVAVRAAEVAAASGIEPGAWAFPIEEFPSDRPAASLAIIRQESKFTVDAVSTADARGYMQLIPSTAEEMAGRLGLPFELDRLTTDPAYNVALGNAYLMGLLDGYGNLMLAAAAYNAGPGPVDDWIDRQGDPSAAGVDRIDWVERIPVNETRNYVQRIIEGFGTYQALLGR